MSANQYYDPNQSLKKSVGQKLASGLSAASHAVSILSDKHRDGAPSATDTWIDPNTGTEHKPLTSAYPGLGSGTVNSQATWNTQSPQYPQYSQTGTPQHSVPSNNALGQGAPSQQAPTFFTAAHQQPSQTPAQSFQPCFTPDQQNQPFYPTSHQYGAPVDPHPQFHAQPPMNYGDGYGQAPPPVSPAPQQQYYPLVGGASNDGGYDHTGSGYAHDPNNANVGYSQPVHQDYQSDQQTSTEGSGRQWGDPDGSKNGWNQLTGGNQ